MKILLTILISILLIAPHTWAADTDTSFVTPFEKSGGRQSATYTETIDFYNRLCKKNRALMMGDIGTTDIGFPLRIILYTRDADFKKDDWKRENRIVIFINNDIHPGEPDGVDACMMLLRDAAMGKIDIPGNVVLAVVPIYNIGGALNRNSYSRANQNGPESYGFRGNSRNLDLNRDFMKCDAAETSGFEEQFSRLNPDIFIDNHVSDGADYQHIMTLLASQHDKAGGEIGAYMYNTLTPALYRDMKAKGYDLVPYVNDFNVSPDHGWREFYDPPRFSSGYATLFHTMAYVPETHMLKPFRDRVKATYDLMECFIKEGSEHAKEIRDARAHDRETTLKQKNFPLEWRLDTTHCDSITFKGYEAGYKTSLVSGLPRLYYDHDKPYTRKVPFYDHFVPSKSVKAPQAYIIPKTWVPVISLLRSNGVRLERFYNDTLIDVTAYHIDNYETLTHPYEKHYLHYNVQVTPEKVNLPVAQGDYIVWLDQPAKRYLIEALEPTAPDALFAWNYFDGILQQKEYFSDYVFEDMAADYLDKKPAIRKQLEEKRATDTTFAKSADAQLDFVYRHSPYFEKSVNRYPIYRIE